MPNHFSNQNSLITIPCHWDKEVIWKILSQNSPGRGITVKEVYGVLAKGGPVGHGRSSKAVVQVTPEDAVAFVRFLHAEGLKFTYLLNAPFHFHQDSEQKRQLDQYLDWILGELKPDALMISSHELMQCVRQRDKEVDIHVSTIASVKDTEGLVKFMDVKPVRLVAHHDVGKIWQNLERLVDFGRKNNVAIELMTTESCLFQCPNRERHYEHLARKGASDTPFHLTCNATKFTHPREFLMAGGVIRPEDVSLYEELGINCFKLTGRSKPSTWLPETASAYQKREYGGNLIRLLGIDPSLRAEEWLFVNNKALEGFAANFPRYGSNEEKASYCDAWAIKLYSEGNIRISDGTQYLIEGQTLSLVGQGGEKIAPIIIKERGR